MLGDVVGVRSLRAGPDSVLVQEALRDPPVDPGRRKLHPANAVVEDVADL
jgi:hypothetical protein